jgi:hypothetical protein
LIEKKTLSRNHSIINQPTINIGSKTQKKKLPVPRVILGSPTSLTTAMMSTRLPTHVATSSNFTNLLGLLVLLGGIVSLTLTLSLSYRVSKSNTLNPSRPFRQLYEGVEESRQKQRSAPVVDISVTMMEG